MADVLGEVVRSFSSTLRGTLVFSGRSTIRDVIYFWLAAGLVTLPVYSAILATLAWDEAVIARLTMEALISLPFFALFIRRLHDQDRTGWWILMLPPLMAFNVYQTIHVSFAVLDPQWSPVAVQGQAWGLLLLPFGAASVLFMFLPGTIGPNQHGPDPRKGGGAAAAT